RELKVAVYYSGISSERAKAVADAVTQNLSRAGVKNVSYELKEGAPSVPTVLRYELLPTPHSHLLELRLDREGHPTIRAEEAGHNWDVLGGHSAVATSGVGARAKGDSGAFTTGLANVATHELAHDALGHSNSEDFMKEGGATSDDWLFSRHLGFTTNQ